MLMEIGIALTSVGVVGVAAASPKMKMSDRRKIERIFKNLSIGVKEDGKFKYPKFIRKYPIQRYDDETIGTRYVYSLPFGISGKILDTVEKEGEVFKSGLKKTVTTKCENGILNVNVFNEDIPDFFLYEKLPSPKKKWAVPVGITQDELIWHNFDHTPHMTIAGTTRFGKTVLLKLLLTYLIENNPDDVDVYIIDLKGGLEFGKYENVKQIKGVASDPLEAYEMLTNIFQEIELDKANFRKQKWSNITDTPNNRRKFVIVDEGAQLAPTQGMKKSERELLFACQAALSEIARVAGALGYRLIFATQYPTADTLPRQIKQNADAKITFRLPTIAASHVAIDDLGAEQLPSDLKGRALFKTHELREMQVPFISDEEMTKRLERFEEDVIIECPEEESETGAYFRELD